MSSSLNLTPDVTVVAVQAGLFLTNMWVVKKLMLEPYLSLRSKRDQATKGSDDKAVDIITRANQMDAEIASQLRAAHLEASKRREEIKSKAVNERAAVLAKAEAEAKAAQSALVASIKSELQSEQKKKDELIQKTKDDLIMLVTN